MLKATKRAAMAAALATVALMSGEALAAGEAVPVPVQEWQHGGIFGTFDRASAQRGFQVYKEVCASCHSMNLLSYRHLQALGFTEKEVQAIAAQDEVTAGPNDDGEMYQRKAIPADRFKAPFANEQAARAANGGAYPPDLSVIVKARPGGEDYIHALLVGYEQAPAGFQLGQGMHYNKYFPGHQIAMPAPLSEGQVTYADGAPNTVEQMSKDVTTFLTWAAEPNLEVRKQTGVKVMLFLLVMAGMLYAVKRKVWADVH
ncbi:MAG TPA: cytochrome c1 [Azospirillaceae bacterium]|nr:cytochrome c1 [Azospirillaceae bacterium]